MKANIYKIAKNLGLDRKDIDGIMSNSVSTTNRPASVSDNTYKAGTEYGTVSPKEIYKAGTWYGTVSVKDVYKAGTLYGTVSIKDF